MDKNYLLESTAANKQYQKYLQDFGLIFRESFNTGKDIAAYILRDLKMENNPEIGRALIESMFSHQLTTVASLKIIVKILYVTGHIQAYRYNTHHALKKEIDEALKKVSGNKAELVRKKYPRLLEKLNKEKSAAKTQPDIADKTAAAESLVDNINRQYINFVKG
jgi:predicted amidophosphoribosyltransferase